MFSNRMKWNRFFLIAFIVMFVFILSLSRQDASTSNALSMRVTQEIMTYTVSEPYEAAKVYNTLIRDVAHVVLFGILGGIVMVGLVLNDYPLKKASGLTLVIIFFCALLDESLQLFSDGRAFQVEDLGKDVLGAILSILLVVGIRQYAQRRRKHKNQMSQKSSDAL